MMPLSFQYFGGKKAKNRTACSGERYRAAVEATKLLKPCAEGQGLFLESFTV
jgi:hypothetical protein